MTNGEAVMITSALRYHARALEKESKSRKWGGERFAESRKRFRDMAKARYELAHLIAAGMYREGT